MKQKAFITGISGFAGSHLADYLVKLQKYDIFGTYLTENSLINVDFIKDNLHLKKVDLRNAEEVFEVLSETKPDVVFHLAALPSVVGSFDNPAETIVNNIAVQVNVLEGMKRLGLTDSTILIVSSADVYGNVSKEYIPSGENTPFNPTSTYAVSKIAQDFLGLQYFNSFKLKTVRARPFNHIGPRQSPGFAVADFAKKIAEIEAGKQDAVLMVGNLDARRDFTDVRDVVAAYELLSEKGKAGDVYNIGSGVSHKIREILDILLSYSSKIIEVKIDEKLFRPEALERVCDNTKIKKLTGWEPKINLEKSLKDTLDYWRNIV